MSNGINFPWIRQMKLHISGLVDSSVPQIGAFGIAGHMSKTFESDGSMNKLRIDATISQSVQRSIQVGTIDIWNLSPETRSGFSRKTTKVSLHAGWRDGPFSGMSQVFYGDVLASQHQRQGPDIVSTLFVQSGLSAAEKAFVKGSWKQGTQYRDIVLDIAKNMSSYGVAVDPKLVKGIEGYVGEKGYSCAGSVGDILTRLGGIAGFWWTIANNRFQTISKDPSKADGAIPSKVEIQDPYLINVGSTLTGVRQHIRGVVGQCILTPGLLPGYEMKIRSEIDKSCNGSWRATNVEHSLSCFTDGSFITRFTGKDRRVSK